MKQTIANEQFMCFSYLLFIASGMVCVNVVYYYDWKLFNPANDECGDVDLSLVLISSCFIFHLFKFLLHVNVKNWKGIVLLSVVDK